MMNLLRQRSSYANLMINHLNSDQFKRFFEINKNIVANIVFL